MSDLTTEQKTAIDDELGKVGKTVAKMANAALGWLETLGGTLSPVVERVLTNVLTGLLDSWGKNVLRKNGVKVD